MGYVIANPLDSKRLVVKDSAVNAVCYGAKLMLPGLLRYGKPITPNSKADDETNLQQKAVLVRLPVEPLILAAPRSCLMLDYSPE